MDRTTRLEIVQHGLRWANNIICEVLSNHGSMLPREAREAVMEATRALGTAIEAIRAAQ